LTQSLQADDSWTLLKINSDCFFFWGLAIVAGWQSNRKRSDKQGTADERTALMIETIGTNWKVHVIDCGRKRSIRSGKLKRAPGQINRRKKGKENEINSLATELKPTKTKKNDNVNPDDSEQEPKP
jgi:hypothetical protein